MCGRRKRRSSCQSVSGRSSGMARAMSAKGSAQSSFAASPGSLASWLAPLPRFPENPGGWLMLAEKHRAIDRLRRDDRLRRKLGELGHQVTSQQQMAAFSGVADFDAVLDEGGVKDDILRLTFISCHPVLSTEARIALPLRLLGRLTTQEIARAFLVSEATVAQRIVPAKRTLARERVPFQLPPPADRAR